jgi:hypothetical protein
MITSFPSLPAKRLDQIQVNFACDDLFVVRGMTLSQFKQRKPRVNSILFLCTASIPSATVTYDKNRGAVKAELPHTTTSPN